MIELGRRAFLKGSAATVAAYSTIPAGLVLVNGCGAGTIAALIKTLGNAASQIAAMEGNTTLAQQITTDTAAAVTAVTNWKSGSPVQMAVEALNIVMDDLNLFPAAAAFAPWINLAIITVEAILALLPAPIAAHALATHPNWRHPIKHQPAPKTASAFVSQWNTMRALNPSVNVPEIAEAK